jgi:zinc-ribbon domain
MKCPVCNAELPSTAKFCGGCGTTLTAPQSPSTPAPPPPYAPSSPAMNSAPSYGAGGYSGASYGAAGYGGSAMPAVKKKYKTLRLIAVLMKVLAVIAGAILIIAGLVMIVAGAASSSKTTPTFGDPGPAAFFGGLVGGLVLFVYGVFVFIFLYAYAEWMYVFMDIEENTRVTNEMLSARK